jgi:hypothetical protein
VESLIVAQLIPFICLQALFFSRGEDTGIVSMLPGIRVAGLAAIFTADFDVLVRSEGG